MFASSDINDPFKLCTSTVPREVVYPSDQLVSESRCLISCLLMVELDPSVSEDIWMPSEVCVVLDVASTLLWDKF